MKEYKREYPMFSLCGLNCGLCPRHHTDGSSKCPGCGGNDFHLKHPSCAVINCNFKRDKVEYCFQCSSYPCEKYKKTSSEDSFITYKNVIPDFNKAKLHGIKKLQKEINEKIKILHFLLENYNDGKKKNFYCLAVNLIDLPEFKNLMKEIDAEIKKMDVDKPEKIKYIVEKINSLAKKRNIEIKLRKKPLSDDI